MDEPVRMPTWKPRSLAARGLGWIDSRTGAVMPPLHLSSTFVRAADNTYPSGRIYGRADNPNYDQPEALLAKLESGADAALFSSGMAAASAVFLALSPGDHVIAPATMYWGLRNWLLDFAVPWGLRVEFVDMSEPSLLKPIIRPGETRLVWIETPANPTWAITEIKAVSESAHAAGARVAVDSTVATPVLTQPLLYGADIVMHSGTKYLNGHSDVIAGALVTSVKDAYWDNIKAIRSSNGAVLGSLETWLLLRGMRTLHLRVGAASATALRIAQHLTLHPAIKTVLYPGLPGFPGHEVARRQMHGGFGAMLSIRLLGGEPAALAAAANLRLWTRATSLGGVESLVEHRASVEGDRSEVPRDLLRLSVGIEDPDDLIADLDFALNACACRA